MEHHTIKTDIIKYRLLPNSTENVLTKNKNSLISIDGTFLCKF